MVTQPCTKQYAAQVYSFLLVLVHSKFVVALKDEGIAKV